MAKGKGGGAPHGNKNASKKIGLANLGGFISGAVHQSKYNENALKMYQKYGAGMTGYKAGAITRKVVTLGLAK